MRFVVLIYKPDMARQMTDWGRFDGWALKRSFSTSEQASKYAWGQRCKGLRARVEGWRCGR